jgi:large conductance mechanosensitive channel
MFKGFRDFILRGNVVDLAVAVVIGTAFGAVVTAFTKGIIMQFVAALIKTPDFDKVVYDLHGTPIQYGTFLTSAISFLIIAKFKKAEPEAAATIKPCPECLSEIPIAAKRCKFCTQPVA